MMFCYTVGKRDATLTAQHFGISKKTFMEQEHGEVRSTWKIERVIRRYKLYPDQRKAEKTSRKRARALKKPKKRVTSLVKEGRACFLFQLDTIVIYWDNLKRYILTAVDHASKLAYAGCTRIKAQGRQQTSYTGYAILWICLLKIF